MDDYAFPKAIGKCADLYYELRQKRYELQRNVDEIAKEEKALKQHIIDTLPKSEASGVAGSIARVTVVVKEEPQVKSYSAFRRYINRTKQHHLANKLRPSPVAIREMWEDGKNIPGIEKFNVVTVSLNKV